MPGATHSPLHSPKKQMQALYPPNWQNFIGGAWDNLVWLKDFNPDNFYVNPRQHLISMFAAYQNALSAGGLS